MSEKLGFREIDASVLSRVLKGERVFTQYQLSVFCKVIKLDRVQEDLLKASLHSEIYSRFQGRYLLDINKNQFIDMTESNLIMAKDANQSGASIMALRWSEAMESKLREEIIITRDNNASDKLIELLYEFLGQHSISILRREPPSIAYKNVWKVLTEMEELANRLKSRERLGLVLSKKGDVLSLVGGESGDRTILNRSSKFFKKSLKYINPSLCYYPIGYWMLNEGYLKNTRQVNNLAAEFVRILEGCDPSDACEGYNLIAKSKVLIGDSENLERTFVSGWESFNKIPDDGLHSKQYRKVQLSRTEVQAFSAGYKFYGSKKIKGILTDCLYSAKNLGYMRYYLTTKVMVRESKGLISLGVSI